MSRGGLLALSLALASCAAPAAPARPAAKPALAARPAAPVDRRAAACSEAAAPAPAPARQGDARLGALLAPPPAGAAPGPGRVGLPDAPPQGTVARVEISGSAQLDAGSAVTQLSTRAGAPLDPAGLRQDLQRLWALGLFEDVVAAAEAQPGGGLVVRIQLRDQPPLGERFVEGAARWTAEELLDAAGLAGAGQRFHPRRLHAARARLRERYREEGHRLAEISTLARPADGGVVDVCLRIAEGPLVTLSRWDFTGNQAVPEAELRGLMVTQGGRYNAPGGIYREEMAELDLLRITAHYYDRGMIEAQVGPVEVTEAADRRSLSVVVPIREGPVYRVGKVSLSGSPRARRYEQGLEIRRGQVFDRSRLAQEVARLQERVQREEQRQVEINPETTLNPASRTVDLSLRIEDRAP